MAQMAHKWRINWGNYWAINCINSTIQLEDKGSIKGQITKNVHNLWTDCKPCSKAPCQALRKLNEN